MPRRRAAARTAFSSSSEIRRFTDYRLGLYSNGNGARFSALMYSDKSFSSSSSASLSLLSAGNLFLIFSDHAYGRTPIQAPNQDSLSRTLNSGHFVDLKLGQKPFYLLGYPLKLPT